MVKAEETALVERNIDSSVSNVEMTGYDTEENKKNRQIICTILKEELKLVEKEELEEE